MESLAMVRVLEERLRLEPGVLLRHRLDLFPDPFKRVVSDPRVLTVTPVTSREKGP